MREKSPDYLPPQPPPPPFSSALLTALIYVITRVVTKLYQERKLQITVLS